jgi:prepilin-type N-terminal cleavage/methylation domain-containing protein
MRKKRGFTLIELLVVIAIIAMLLSILMPALQMAKVQAEKVICRANLHSWGLIWPLYHNDYDGDFMIYGRKNSFSEQLRDYYEDPKIRLCPSAKKFANPTMDDSISSTGSAFIAWGKMPAPPPSWDPPPWIEGDYGSYGMNGWASKNESGGDRGQWAWGNIDDVTTAGVVPLTIDCTHRGMLVRNIDDTEFNNFGLTPPTNEEHNGSGSRINRACLNRHNKEVNSLFMDFSVRAVGLKELWTLKWHRDFDIRNKFTLADGATRATWDNHEWMQNYKDY